MNTKQIRNVIACFLTRIMHAISILSTLHIASVNYNCGKTDVQTHAYYACLVKLNYMLSSDCRESIFLYMYDNTVGSIDILQTT